MDLSVAKPYSLTRNCLMLKNAMHDKISKGLSKIIQEKAAKMTENVHQSDRMVDETGGGSLHNTKYAGSVALPQGCALQRRVTHPFPMQLHSMRSMDSSPAVTYMYLSVDMVGMIFDSRQ